jgi:isopenicillin N synthase-like dioxygenase
LPGFRETCLEYYDAMSALGLKMLTVHAVALSLPPNTGGNRINAR